MAQKGHNFLSDNLIALKVLEEFTEVVFLGVATKLILGDPEVWSRETRVTIKKCHNFCSTIGSCSIIYRTLQRLFSL